MKIQFSAVIIFLLITNVLLPQEIYKISSTYQLDSLKNVSKGNIILFNFWATWCHPCIEEFPDIVKLYNNNKKNDFRVIFISLDFPGELESKVKPFLKSNNVDFPSFFGDFKKPEELMDYFDKNWDGAIPATFIFDKNGGLKYKYIGSRSYEKFEKELLIILGQE